MQNHQSAYNNNSYLCMFVTIERVLLSTPTLKFC